jgi:GlcNAc-P-P-Und epimerase
MKILCTGASGFIGSNFVQKLMTTDVDIMNIDIKEPRNCNQLNYWRYCDILDFKSLKNIFLEFKPTHVVHLAARTDIEGKTLEDYRTNIQGTANVLTAIKATTSVSRAVIASTQFVYKPGSLPCTDEDYAPFTVYGQSKVITEQLTRQADLDCTWTIIRPTIVWGPWHSRYPNEIWRLINKKLYFHPGRKPVIRSYGYVGNVIFQITKILQAPDDLVDRRVFYLGDMPISQLEWANAFSLALTGREVRIVPKGILSMVALCGDILALFNIRCPMNTSRFRRMTEHYLTPMDPIKKAIGESPFSLEMGVQVTVDWLRNHRYL